MEKPVNGELQQKYFSDFMGALRIPALSPTCGLEAVISETQDQQIEKLCEAFEEALFKVFGHRNASEITPEQVNANHQRIQDEYYKYLNTNHH